MLRVRRSAANWRQWVADSLVFGGLPPLVDVLPRFVPPLPPSAARIASVARDSDVEKVQRRPVKECRRPLQILRIEHQLQLPGQVGDLLRAGRWPSRSSQRADRTLPQTAVA